MKPIIVVPWGFALAIALVAGGMDWRSRRIPNWLTVTGFFIGVIINTALLGWAGAKTALAGAGIPLAMLLPVVLLHGLGAGDWKLIGALGAIVGRAEIVHVLLAAILIAGLIAVAQMVREKRALVTLRNLCELVRGFFVFGLKPHPEINLDNADASSLPFGVAVAAGTLLCCGVVLAGV